MISSSVSMNLDIGIPLLHVQFMVYSLCVSSSLVCLRGQRFYRVKDYYNIYMAMVDKVVTI